MRARVRRMRRVTLARRWERLVERVSDALDRERAVAVRNGKTARAMRLARIVHTMDNVADRSFLRRMDEYRNGI